MQKFYSFYDHIIFYNIWDHIIVYICHIESPKWTNCRTFIVECTTMLFNVRLCTHWMSTFNKIVAQSTTKFLSIYTIVAQCNNKVPINLYDSRAIYNKEPLNLNDSCAINNKSLRLSRNQQQTYEYNLKWEQECQWITSVNENKMWQDCRPF